MDPATIATVIKTTQTVVKVGREVYQYLKDDQSAKFELLVPVKVIVTGPGVGIGSFRSSCGTFAFVSASINRVEFQVGVLTKSNTWWNGPDLITNKPEGGRVPGSLVHDGICNFLAAIAAELGIPEDEVWEWAAGIMSSIWEAYDSNITRGSSESWMSYQIVEPFHHTYKTVKRWLGFSALLAMTVTLSGCGGCQQPPDWTVVEADPVIWQSDGRVYTNMPALRP